MITASRCLYALSTEGHLPRTFGRAHAGTGAPVQAILLTSALSLVVALSGSYVELAVLSVIARFTQFIPTFLGILVLRKRSGEPPFKVPLGPTIPVLALLLCGWLLSQAEPRQLLWGVVAIAAGGAIYVARRRFA